MTIEYEIRFRLGLPPFFTAACLCHIGECAVILNNPLHLWKKMTMRIHESEHSVLTNWKALELTGISSIGRCWDLCLQTPLMNTSEHTVVSSSSPLCSHAYIISRHAAQVLFRWSQPHVTSVDLCLQCQERESWIYWVYLLLCTYRTAHSHDTTQPVECDTSQERQRRERRRRSAQVAEARKSIYFR